MLLAIESSCDESALAVFDPEKGVIGEWIHSQIKVHQDYGGVVPELASREHLSNLVPLMDNAELNKYRKEIKTITVTQGPGLAGCLAMGLCCAQSLACAWDVPLLGINHLHGHAYSPFIPLHAADPKSFHQQFESALPHLGLLVSGGNTILFTIDRLNQLSVVAETLDDAAGEALDKGAKLLGLGYPGGPKVEQLARLGQPQAFDFPRAISPKNQHRFSFSGLKTSLRYRLEKLSLSERDNRLNDLCASYQQAVVDQLITKTKHILQQERFKSIGLSGGVSNNKILRTAFQALAGAFKVQPFIARPEHTGDNASMIAFSAYANPKLAHPNPQTIKPALSIATG
jgi:N6-L-threonylcarbamoyladenine synthase